MQSVNTVLATVLVATVMLSVPVRAEPPPSVSIGYRGNLVAEPCVIPPGDEEISLDFDTIIDKFLYQHTRTLGQTFEIRLTECDLTLGSLVSVTFQGTESLALPGLLALDGGSQATGVAIGLETPQARPLPLNKASDKYRLDKGTNLIALRAYVQGEPTAITNQSIGLGAFTATATFNLDYE
jgi:type 1 fimbria pilin